MALSEWVRRGELPQLALAVLFLFIFSACAEAQVGATGGDPWSVPDSLSGDGLKSELGMPLADNPDQVLSKWKKFEPTPIARKEGSVVYYNADAGQRNSAQPLLAPTPIWKKWLLPGGLILAAVMLLSLALLAWRAIAARRAAFAAEIASRYVLPVNRK